MGGVVLKNCAVRTGAEHEDRMKKRTPVTLRDGGEFLPQKRKGAESDLSPLAEIVWKKVKRLLGMED